MRGSEFPAQTGRYAVKVKNGAGWRAFETARLQISVGQPYHEGAKLEATLGWVRHRFAHAVICVNDTLQRHNRLFEGHGASLAEAFSRAAGDDWITRNGPMIRDVLPSVDVWRWDAWRHHPTFAPRERLYHALYRENRAFRADLEDDISTFWARHLRKGGTGDADVFRAHARRYLLEECAAFSLMFDRDRAVDIYPGSALLPCVAARKYLGVETHFTRIDFAARRPGLEVA